MQTSTRIREPNPRSFAARRGHLPNLSISDDAHHVTEAIGHMYGDEDSPTTSHASRTSYRSDKSTSGEFDTKARQSQQLRRSPGELRLNGDRGSFQEQQSRPMLHQAYSWEMSNGGRHNSTPGAQDKSPSDTATTHFPLNDIDYESSPAAVAQELSNLQALRRMSMDFSAAGDPDLPSLNTTAIPGAPSPTSSEDDSSRLFWVPASLHPELAPQEFKTFLDSKAEQIKRRSGDLSQFGSPTSSRGSSLSSNDGMAGLRRKKSMLSRQIENPLGYQDGAERLERKKSRDSKMQMDTNLEEVESLISGGSDGPRTSQESVNDEETNDIILPSVLSSSLKRSTRTKYQKKTSSLKSRPDRSTYAQRAARRTTADGQDDPSTPIDTDVPPLPTLSTEVTNLASTLNDPTSARGALNFSRPGDRIVSPPPIKSSGVPSPTFDLLPSSSTTIRHVTPEARDTNQQKAATSILPGPRTERPIPQIVESPPVEERPARSSSMRPPPTKVYTIPSSSQPMKAEQSKGEPVKTTPSRPGMPSKQSSATLSGSRSPQISQDTMPPLNTPSQSLNQPSPLPGNDGNTSNLSFIPTLSVDKRPEQKKKEEKKSGWSWLLGKEESDKDREKARAKGAKSPQNHDNTRLDVLQTSIDGGGRGRESLVLDRESLKLEEERKKESQRKTNVGGEKKEKESIFSSIFGGKKHKTEKDSHKRQQDRLSPEPPYRVLQPDVDYNWTRFSILEERAIYRMAHIKLANPRRALYSQVLLSNFMYSYLAKVQQMHPQMKLPTSAKQQRKQKEQQQQQMQQPQQQPQPQQPDEYAQYQRYQQQQAQSSQSQPNPQQPGPAGHPAYENDSGTYVHDVTTERVHNPESEPQRPNSRGKRSNGGPAGDDYGSSNGPNSYSITGGRNSAYNHSQQQSQQQRRQNNRREDDHNDDDDMW